MTPELIKKWAEEADQMADDQLQCPGEFHPDWHEVRDGLFAALVAAHEREQCAKAVESLEAKLPSLEDYEDTGAYLVWEVSQKHDDRWIEQPIAAAAIRSRKDAR